MCSTADGSSPLLLNCHKLKHEIRHEQFSKSIQTFQAIATYELVEQCSSVVTEPVCLPDPTTMQQLIGESAVTSSRGQVAKW